MNPADSLPTTSGEHAPGFAMMPGRAGSDPIPACVTFRYRQPNNTLDANREFATRLMTELACNPSLPVGFIEGWYVAPAHRRRRIGARLVAAAEAWARNQGCTDMASDTWLEAFNSQRAHEALGFEVVNRCIHFRKQL
jgi:aminoglycoside 6'-N-acetyltransferase I